MSDEFSSEKEPVWPQMNSNDHEFDTKIDIRVYYNATVKYIVINKGHIWLKLDKSIFYVGNHVEHNRWSHLFMSAGWTYKGKFQKKETISE